MNKRNNTVVAVHDGVARPYQWYIPRRFSKLIDKGTRVKVQTKYGTQEVTVIKKRRVEKSRLIHRKVIGIVK